MGSTAIHQNAGFATREANYCSRGAATEMETQIVHTTNVLPAGSFCASRTIEDSIRTILSVLVASQAGGRSPGQQRRYLEGSIMYVVGVDAISTFLCMANAASLVLTRK